MGLFICDNCGSIENTALGHYWSRKYVNFKDSSKNGMALCSECIPLEFDDGSKSGNGKWHGKFKKEKFDKEKHGTDFLNFYERSNKETKRIKTTD